MALRQRLDAQRARGAADEARRAEQTAILQNDPEFQRILRENGGFNVGGMVRRIKELGIEIDDDDAVRPGTGNVVKGRTFWDKYGPLILGAGGIVGGGLALGALGGGGAAAGAGAAPSAAGSAAGAGATGAAAVPTLGSTVGPGVGFGAGGVPIASTATGLGTTATGVLPGVVAGAAKTMPFWQKALMGFGTDVAKTVIGNVTSSKANKALQEGGDKALAEFQRTLGPFVSLGTQSAGELGRLMGLPGGGPSLGPMPTAPAGAPQTGRSMPQGATPIGTAVPRPASQMGTPPLVPGSLGNLGGQPQAQLQTASSYVKMRAPDGSVEDVAASMVPHYKARGAQEVTA